MKKTGSLCCTVEIVRTLSIDYTLIKKVKNNLRKDLVYVFKKKKEKKQTGSKGPKGSEVFLPRD